MQVLGADGVKLTVAELGSGPPMLLLHGMFPGSMATWYLTAGPLLAQRHRVVFFDFRGHGMSERTQAGYDIPTMTRDVEAVMDAAVGAEPAIVVGYSYGGVLALSYALRNPGRVKKLVVFEAPLPPSTHEELPDIDTQVQRDRNDMIALLPRFARDVLVPGSRRERLFGQGLLDLVYKTTLYEDVRQARDFDDAELATIAAPVLAIYGTESKIRRVGERLRRVVPGTRLVELPGDHYLMLETPGKVAAVIEEFVHG